MADLEEEFKKLVDGMYKAIAAKESNGDLTRYEAQDLREMVYERTLSDRDRQARAWHNSGCSIGDDYESDYTYDEGWSPSMVC